MHTLSLFPGRRPAGRLFSARILSAAALLGGAALALAPAAHAAVINNFESGAFGANSALAGDGSVVSADFFTPAAGTRQALVTTFSTGADGGNVSGQDARTAAGAETFLGLEAGTLAANGASFADASAFTLTQLVLNAGDVVSFDYNFLTSATAADGRDFAFVTLQRGGEDPEFRLFSSATAATTASTSAFFDRETGARTLTLPGVLTAGTYTLGFGVTDAFDDAVGSGLLIDNVQVNAVPEPSSLVAMLGLGAAGLLAWAKRRV